MASFEFSDTTGTSATLAWELAMELSEFVRYAS